MSIEAAIAAGVIGSANQAWLAADESGTIVGWNPAAEEMFGWSAADALGRRMVDVIVPQALRDRHRRLLERSIASGGENVDGRRLESSAMHRDGHEFPVELSVSAIAIDGTTFFQAFVQDITQRRHTGRFIAAQRAVATLLVAPPRDLVPAVARALGEALDCQVATVWTRPSEAAAPQPQIVRGPMEPAEAWRDSMGLRGSDPLDEVWSDASAVFRRGSAASKNGAGRGPAIRSGICLPVVVKGEVTAVIELLSTDVHTLDQVAVDMLGSLASQVGHALEQRGAEARVVELSTQNQRILEASSEAIVGLDADGRVSFANPAAGTIVGIEAAELVGRSFHETVCDGRHAEDDCFISRVCGNENTERGAERFSIERREGRIIEGSCSPLSEAGGSGGGAVLSFRDATQRHVTEAVRQRNLTFLETLLDAMHEGVLACDAYGRMTLANRAMQELAGGPLEGDLDEVMRNYDLIDPLTGRSLSPESRPLRRALRGEDVRDLEVLFTPEGGNERLLTVNAGQIVDAGGEVLGAVTVVHDLTEHRAAEKRMADAERLAGAGAWEIDFDTRDVFWSPGLYRLLGLEPGSVEPTEERFKRAMHPDDVERAYGSLARAVDGGFPQWEVDYRITRADGEVRSIHSFGQILRDANGRAVRARGTLQDFTDRMEAERALRRTEARARQSERMESLGQLAGGIAHDFNNLLAVILNYSQFALEDLPTESSTRTDVEEIRRAAQRAADLTRRLLVFSRREVVRPQFVDLGVVVRGLEPLLQRTLGENLEIVIEIAPGIGPISADPGQIEQMLINLALNARDAMPTGGALRVNVESVQLQGGEDDLDPGRYVRVRVSDTGTGMTPEVAAHVFEPFFTTKPKGQGTGLGLATVYGVINEAGGAISVRSTPGKGSTFTIHLPAAFGAPIGLGESALEEAPAQESARRRVLIVEDDAAVRRVGCRILEGAGYDVLEAAAADEAIEVLEEVGGEVSLLLTDVVMPGASGWDLHTTVVQRWPGIPTLFMSGYTDDLIGREKLSGDGIDFIAKPFGSSELLAAVRAHAS